MDDIDCVRQHLVSCKLQVLPCVGLYVKLYFKCLNVQRFGRMFNLRYSTIDVFHENYHHLVHDTFTEYLPVDCSSNFTC
jgi:hypothetical protein